jgi:hypothetical protein
VANTLILDWNGAIGFIDWLDERCPNSLWRLTDAVAAWAEAAVSGLPAASVSALALVPGK